MKVRVAILGSLSLKALWSLCGHEATLEQKKKGRKKRKIIFTYLPLIYLYLIIVIELDCQSALTSVVHFNHDMLQTYTVLNN